MIVIYQSRKQIPVRTSEGKANARRRELEGCVFKPSLRLMRLFARLSTYLKHFILRNHQLQPSALLPGGDMVRKWGVSQPVKKTNLIWERAVGSHEDVVCDGLSENLHLQDVGQNFFRLAIEIYKKVWHLL